jgi:uncharacterized protein
MSGAIGAYLDGSPDGRLHLQHGPIDLVIGVAGGPPGRESALRAQAYQKAAVRFSSVLEDLVAELPLLKARAYTGCPQPQGPVARRMMAAVTPLSKTHFITPMAAVAGAVADEVLEAMLSGFAPGTRPSRLYVNNGGDIALHLDHDAAWRVGMAREDGAGLGTFIIRSDDPVRGIATSGQGGRSLSMGIATSVTVLAKTAAAADAAATIIANAVDLPGHPAIIRTPANRLVEDSDLGERLVVTACGDLDEAEIAEALDRGQVMAEHLKAQGLIDRSALFLRNRVRTVGEGPSLQIPNNSARLERYAHA